MNYDGYRFEFACDPVPTEEQPFEIITDTGDNSIYNVEKNIYNGRFGDYSAYFNIAGYGALNPFVPPLRTPNSVIAVYDRYLLLTHSSILHNPILNGFYYWWNGLGTGDTKDDLFYYNTPEASGAQLYPTGLNKYYDLYSADGLWIYFWDYVVTILESLITPLTLFIPISVWIAMFDGSSWDESWKIFFFY